MKRILNLLLKINTLLDDVLSVYHKEYQRSSNGHVVSKGYIKLAIFIKMVAIIKNISFNTAIKEVKNPQTLLSKKLRRICSLDVTKRWMYELFHHPTVLKYQKMLHMKLLKKCVKKKSLEVLSIDMTDLPSTIRDSFARFGGCSKGKFYGYKLHMVCSKEGLPLAYCLTDASVRETSQVKKLLKQVRRIVNIEDVWFVTADKGYDAHHVYESVADILDALALIPENPRGKKKADEEIDIETSDDLRQVSFEMLKLPEGKHIFSFRTGIERMFGLLKVHLEMDVKYLCYRGIKKLMRILGDYLLSMYCIIFFNKLRHKSRFAMNF